MLPRISLILALDNFGQSYVALTQINTDSDVMILFFRDLVKLLNEEDRRWRTKTLIFLDGAKYHQSEETLKVCKELDIPLMVSSPYGYSCSPCELWYSLFKRVNLNPRKIKTNKSWVHTALWKELRTLLM